MAIYVSVQHNGGFLPDIILLTYVSTIIREPVLIPLCGFVFAAFCMIFLQQCKISPVLSTCPLHTNSGCGKERQILIGPW